MPPKKSPKEDSGDVKSPAAPMSPVILFTPGDGGEEGGNDEEVSTAPVPKAGKVAEEGLVALKGKAGACRMELGAAVEELDRLKEVCADFFDSALEFESAFASIDSNPVAYLDPLVASKPFKRKLAAAVIARNAAAIKSQEAEEMVLDVNLTPGEVKAELRRELHSQKKINKELTNRLGVLEQVLIAVCTSPQFGNFKLVGGGGITSSTSMEPLLNHALREEHDDVVNFLLGNGVKPVDAVLTLQLRNNQGYVVETTSTLESPLYIAIAKNDGAAVSKLLDHGANPSSTFQMRTEEVIGEFKFTTTDKYTPMMIAAAKANVQIAELLVEKGGASATGQSFRVPKGKDGDLMAGFLQVHGSGAVTRA
jgi:hypothetical protein